MTSVVFIIYGAVEARGPAEERKAEKRGADAHPLSQKLDLGELESGALELTPDRLLLLLVRLDLVDLNLLGRESSQHTFLLARQQEQERLALGLIPGRTTDAVDVGVDIFRCVDLDDPVDGREVESARGDIGGEHDGVFRGEETLIDLEPLHLLLLAVHVHEGYTGPHMPEVLVDEADLVRRGRQFRGKSGGMVMDPQNTPASCWTRRRSSW